MRSCRDKRQASCDERGSTGSGFRPVFRFVGEARCDIQRCCTFRGCNLRRIYRYSWRPSQERGAEGNGWNNCGFRQIWRRGRHFAGASK
mmetsp:Transcript_18860/g.54063  ORF Transcript_18860/g.54063 Transcript_18860/m.54063 type:complete len:89 (-) Transcript_18860:1333-1599(-)